MFDYFFYLRGYTQTGATASNAGVALWQNNYGIRHASVRKNPVSIYPHGYDWESKIGSGYTPRVFHEKNSLKGNMNNYYSYGEITYYYCPIPSVSHIDYQIETPSLSLLSHQILIKQMKRRLITEAQNMFDKLYHLWKQECITGEISIHSNPEVLRMTPQYNALLSFCETKPECAMVLAIDKLLNNDILAGFLMEDIMPKELGYLKEKAYLRYEKGMQVIPSMLGNYYRLAEAYLKTIEEEL